MTGRERRAPHGPFAFLLARLDLLLAPNLGLDRLDFAALLALLPLMLLDLRTDQPTDPMAGRRRPTLRAMCNRQRAKFGDGGKKRKAR